MTANDTQPRFMTLEQVAEELAIGMPTAYNLVKSRQLPAIKIGSRGMWRVERVKLEEFIEHMYRETAEGLTEGRTE